MISKGYSLNAIELQHSFNHRKIIVYTGLGKSIEDQKLKEGQAVVYVKVHDVNAEEDAKGEKELEHLV